MEIANSVIMMSSKYLQWTWRKKNFKGGLHMKCYSFNFTELF